MSEEYSFFEDESGNTLAVRNATGEISEAFVMTVPAGSYVITPAGQERRRRAREIERQRAIRRSANQPLGDEFFWLSNAECFQGVSPQNIVRLIYLLTFITYDGRLMMTKRTSINLGNIESVLGISKPSVKKLLTQVVPRYLVVTDVGIMVNEDVRRSIFKGPFTAENRRVDYFKVYISAIRSLYEACPSGSHKRLGKVFSLIPYINLEYNVLCEDPYETDLERSRPLTVRQICSKIGVKDRDYSKWLKMYNRVKFTVKRGGESAQEKLLAVVSTDNTLVNSYVVINPRIMYAGTDYGKVEVLTAFY